MLNFALKLLDFVKDVTHARHDGVGAVFKELGGIYHYYKPWVFGK